MVSTAAPSIFRDPVYRHKVAGWLASDASAEERAACSTLFQLVSKSTVTPGAEQPAIVGSQPTANLTLTGRAASNLSRPSSASHTGRARPAKLQRPSTAGPRMQPGHQGLCIQQTDPHEECSLRPQVQIEHSSQQKMAGCGRVPARNPWSTTNDTFFGFRSQCPGLFNKVEVATRAQPSGDLTFFSEFSESMKLGSNNWKQYLTTTTETVNRSVFPPSLAHQVARDKGFFAWMQRQRLYYGELLTEQAAAELDKALEQAAPEEKVNIMLASRVLYALLQPNKHKSTCHVMHNEQKSLTDAYFEDLQKSVVKEKTMGRTPQPAIRRQVLPSKAECATKCTLASAEGELVQKVGRSNMDIETFKSTIPMKMPIKQAMVRRSLLRGQPDRNPAETVHRVHFPARDPKEMEKSQAAVARAAADAALRKNLSTIPMPPGPQGLVHKHEFITEQRRTYKEHKLDTAANKAASWRAKLACNAPTSTVGVTLGGWTQP